MLKVLRYVVVFEHRLDWRHVAAWAEEARARPGLDVEPAHNNRHRFAGAADLPRSGDMAVDDVVMFRYDR